jgi:cytochrome c oxidase cbb3-type subunit 2
MSALRLVGVPYSDEMIANAKADVEAQIAPDSKGAKDVLARYPKAQVRKFDGEQAGCGADGARCRRSPICKC